MFPLCVFVYLDGQALYQEPQKNDSGVLRIVQAQIVAENVARCVFEVSDIYIYIICVCTSCVYIYMYLFDDLCMHVHLYVYEFVSMNTCTYAHV